MPVFEQGYRRYTGEKATGSRALHIAWQNVRSRMRWWAWLLLGALTCLFSPYAVYAVLIFLTTTFPGIFGDELQSVLPPAPTMVFDDSPGSGGPQKLLALVTKSPLGLVWETLNSASFASLVFPAVLAAGLLASDRRTGALQIYFARPVSRLDYLGGKVLAASYFVALTTVVPTTLLWAESVAFAGTDTYTWRTWTAPVAILGVSALYALRSVALVLWLSSMMRRPTVVAIVAIGINYLLEGVGALLGQALKDPAWTVIQPSRATGALAAPLCGLDVPAWMSMPAAFGLGFALPLALLGIVWWRLKAVEVST